jgi:hypothetical protein
VALGVGAPVQALSSAAPTRKDATRPDRAINLIAV